MPGYVALLVSAESLHNCILAIYHKREIHFYAACSHSPLRSIPGKVRHLSRGDHRFCGCTAGVDTGTGQVRLLDESYGPAMFREGIGNRITPLSGANNDGVARHFESWE